MVNSIAKEFKMQGVLFKDSIVHWYPILQLSAHYPTTRPTPQKIKCCGLYTKRSSYKKQIIFVLFAEFQRLVKADG